MIELTNITKNFNSRYFDSIEVFDKTHLKVEERSSTAIRGRSGSGKSTLIKIIAGLDIDYQGDYYFNSECLSKNEKYMAYFRLKNIGLIMQKNNLLLDRNCYHNIAFPLECLGYNKKNIRIKVNNILELIQIGDLKHKYPHQLSGGQSQKVAIAKALVREPLILLADEPTGSLDEISEDEILTLLKKLSQTLIIATHSDKLSDLCTNEIVIENRKIVTKT